MASVKSFTLMVDSKKETGSKINSTEVHAGATTRKLETCTSVHSRKARNSVPADFTTPKETRSTKVNLKMTEDREKAPFTEGMAKCLKVSSEATIWRAPSISSALTHRPR